MTDLSKIKVQGGWAMDRERFSHDARQLFYLYVPFYRQRVQLPADASRGTRFGDDGDILARLESRFTEAEFLACPGPRIDAALIDAAQSDYWYAHEKRYDDEHYGEQAETEIADED